MTNMKRLKQGGTVLALLLAATLAACGGGGGGCSDDDLEVSFSYPDVFSVYRTDAGVPITTQTPRTEGVPASCEADRRFSLDWGSLPTGVSLDGRTGVISGTPREPGYHLFGVKLTVKGLSGSVDTGMSMRVRDRAAQTFASWDQGLQLPGQPGRLNALNGQLLFVGESPWADSENYLVYESDDAGTSWRMASTVNAPPVARGFSTVAAGGDLLVSGGLRNGTLQGSVWAFDGVNWSSRATTTPFPARRDHLMFTFGGSLYVTGGSDGANPFRDLWRSTDGGRTWSQLSAPFAAQDRRPVCGFELNGRAVIVTVLSSPIPGVSALTEIWSSTDGSDWQLRPTPAGSPLLALPAATSQCVVGDGHAYLLGSFDTVSTADLDHWNFEPEIFSNSFPDIGGAFLNGRMFVANGVGTSTYYLYRTVPR